MFVELIVFFFFFKQKTAYEMRISDWSSDVCSSDLDRDVAGLLQRLGRIIARRTRPDDRDMTHQPISISGACTGSAVPFVVDAMLTANCARASDLLQGAAGA